MGTKIGVDELSPDKVYVFYLPTGDIDFVKRMADKIKRIRDDLTVIFVPDTAGRIEEFNSIEEAKLYLELEDC